jgi:hypothetical protein
MRTTLLASLFAILAFVACKKDAPPVADPGDGTGTAAVGNTGGEVGAGGFSCATDDDCVISCAQKDNCCDQLCPPCRQAYHKDELAQIEAWREGAGACSAQECPVAKCMAPTEETVARCQAGACVVETVALPAQP